MTVSSIISAESMRPVRLGSQFLQTKLRRIRVLVRTPSEARKSWYDAELTAESLRIVVATTSEASIELMHVYAPDVLILELDSRWEGARDVLFAREASPHLRSLPVIVIARNGLSRDAYALGDFHIQSLICRTPSREELQRCIYTVASGEIRESAS